MQHHTSTTTPKHERATGDRLKAITRAGGAKGIANGRPQPRAKDCRYAITPPAPPSSPTRSARPIGRPAQTVGS